MSQWIISKASCSALIRNEAKLEDAEIPREFGLPSSAQPQGCTALMEHEGILKCSHSSLALKLLFLPVSPLHPQEFPPGSTGIMFHRTNKELVSDA